MSGWGSRFALVPLLALGVLAAWAGLAAWILIYPLPDAVRLAHYDPGRISPLEAGLFFSATGLVARQDVADGSSWAVSTARLELVGERLSAESVRIVETRSAEPIAIRAERGSGRLEGRPGAWQVSTLILSGSVEVAAPAGRQLAGPEMEIEFPARRLRSRQPAALRLAPQGELHDLSWFEYDMAGDVLETGIEEGGGIVRALRETEGETP